ncbi:MAG: disulfide bond formation protein DsbA [Ilumatobacteraceae bacterium]|nr:disulfide bond formation protein DsbA [Ilumatobacteraceae bacterium]
MQVEIWSDIACPWCYIGKRRFEAALDAFPHRDEVEIVWRSYQLDPTVPDHYDGSELDYLASRKGFPRAQAAQMFQHVSQQAAAVGLHYDFDSLVVANSFTAHRLLHLAKQTGHGDAVKERLLSAHFEHGRDIGDSDTLVEIGVAAGLDETAIRETLGSDQYTDAVRQDIADGQALGLQGVPFFVIDRAFGISGAQPPEVFANALNQAWTAAHPLQMVPGLDGPTCGVDGCD